MKISESRSSFSDLSVSVQSSCSLKIKKWNSRGTQFKVSERAWFGMEEPFFSRIDLNSCFFDFNSLQNLPGVEEVEIASVEVISLAGDVWSSGNTSTGFGAITKYSDHRIAFSTWRCEESPWLPLKASNSIGSAAVDVSIVPNLQYGLGLRLGCVSNRIIVESFKRHPLTNELLGAEKTGKILLGDEVLSVNGVSMVGWTLSEVIKFIRSVVLSDELQPVSIRVSHRSPTLNSSNDNSANDKQTADCNSFELKLSGWSYLSMSVVAATAFRDEFGKISVLSLSSSQNRSEICVNSEPASMAISVDLVSIDLKSNLLSFVNDFKCAWFEEQSNNRESYFLQSWDSVSRGRCVSLISRPDSTQDEVFVENGLNLRLGMLVRDRFWQADLVYLNSSLNSSYCPHVFHTDPFESFSNSSQILKLKPLLMDEILNQISTPESANAISVSFARDDSALEKSHFLSILHEKMELLLSSSASSCGTTISPDLDQVRQSTLDQSDDWLQLHTAQIISSLPNLKSCPLDRFALTGLINMLARKDLPSLNSEFSLPCVASALFAMSSCQQSIFKCFREQILRSELSDSDDFSVNWLENNNLLDVLAANLVPLWLSDFKIASAMLEKYALQKFRKTKDTSSVCIFMDCLLICAEIVFFHRYSWNLQFWVALKLCCKFPSLIPASVVSRYLHCYQSTSNLNAENRF